MLKKLSKYIKSGNLLDIGCSSGLLLEEAKTIGFNPYGIEISEYASDIAKKRIGKNKIFTGFLEDYKFNNSYFDVITLIDVIEHVKDPINFLKMVKQKLKGGGYIVINTPNTNSITNKIMNSKWPHYNIEHLYYFNIQNFKIISQKLDLKIIYHTNLKKSMKFNYMSFQMKEHNNIFLSKIFSFFDNLNIMKNLNIRIPTGDFFIILQKI